MRLSRRSAGAPAERHSFPPPRAGRGLLIALSLACVLIEAVLQLSDLGLIPRGLRGLAYDFGAFWPGLWGDWQPRYRGQPLLMFLTYGLLHSGLLHMVCNMTVLWSLWPRVAERIGAVRLAALWLLAQLGGGLAYLALSAAERPMVGASGGLFGLAGAMLVVLARHRQLRREGMGPVWGFLLMLVALNALTALTLKGNLAWQAHLGGLAAGALGMMVLDGGNDGLSGRAERRQQNPVMRR